LGGREQVPFVPTAEQALRDLQSCLQSPVLVDFGGGDPRFTDDRWWAQRWRASAPWMEQLRRDPSPLLEACARRATPRLGLYFETLIGFWLQQQGDYDVLGSNIQVRDGRRTIGELDQVIRPRAGGPPEHWELAVKFYLGHPSTTDRGGPRWFGPNARDRLDLKVGRMRDHQLGLAATEPGRAALAALGVEEPVVARGMVKGALYEALNPEYRVDPPDYANPWGARGWWVHARERHRLRALAPPSAGFVVLPRLRWLAPAEASPKTGLEEILRAEVRRPLHVALLDRQGGERNRGFIVPDGWPFVPPS
ncbi:MAG: DUF1853 family protein, partial [Myxococcota bacterium]